MLFALRTLVGPRNHLLDIAERFTYYSTPHHSTTYVDAAYCECSSSVVCRSVCRVGLSPSEPCKNVWSDRGTVCIEDSARPRARPITCSRLLRANTVLCSFNIIQPSSFHSWSADILFKLGDPYVAWSYSARSHSKVRCPASLWTCMHTMVRNCRLLVSDSSAVTLCESTYWCSMWWFHMWSSELIYFLFLL